MLRVSTDVGKSVSDADDDFHGVLDELSPRSSLSGKQLSAHDNKNGRTLPGIDASFRTVVTPSSDVDQQVQSMRRPSRSRCATTT